MNRNQQKIVRYYLSGRRAKRGGSGDWNPMRAVGKEQPEATETLEKHSHLGENGPSRTHPLDALNAALLPYDFLGLTQLETRG